MDLFILFIFVFLITFLMGTNYIQAKTKKECSYHTWEFKSKEYNNFTGLRCAVCGKIVNYDK